MIEDEEMERGSVSWAVYCRFARAMTLVNVLGIFLVYPLQASIIACSNYWLAKWSQQGLEQGNVSVAGCPVVLAFQSPRSPGPVCSQPPNPI